MSLQDEQQAGRRRGLPPLPRPAAVLGGLAAARWERWVVAGTALTLIALAGARPQALRDLGGGGAVLALAARARAVQGKQPDQAAAAWRNIRAYRPRDLAFQEHAAAELFDAYRRAGAQPELAALVAEPQVQAMLRRGAPRLAFRLARALLDSGEAESAVQVLRPAVERAATPQRRRGLALLLAEALSQSGRAADADTLILGLHEATPEDPSLRNALAYQYAVTDRDLDEAETLLRPVLREHAWQVSGRLFAPAEHRRQQANYLDTLAWIRYRQDRLDEAKELLVEAVALTTDAPNPEVLYHLAQICFDLGDDRQAWEWCQKALTEQPRHAEALRLLGLLEGDRHKQLS